MKISLSEGKELVKLARSSIELSFEKKKPKTNKFKEKRGVFVTLLLNNQLRGCMGYTEPVKPLGEATIGVARQAAFYDPRFLALQKKELDEIIVEVSVLTLPKLISVKNPKDYSKKIKLGKDGLIAEISPFRGLLLPQVPIEQKWTKEQFLNNLCLKAGLLEDTWKSKEVKIYKFQAQVFKELRPRGEIVEVKN